MQHFSVAQALPYDATGNEDKRMRLRSAANNKRNYSNEADDTVEYLTLSTTASSYPKKGTAEAVASSSSEHMDLEEESGEDEDEFKMNLSCESVGWRAGSQRKSRKTMRYNEVASGSSDDDNDECEDESTTQKAAAPFCAVSNHKSTVRSTDMPRSGDDDSDDKEELISKSAVRSSAKCNEYTPH